MKDDAGEVIELRCTYDPATRGGDAPDGRKVKATLHWVSARHAATVRVRLYDRLFTKPNPEDAPAGEDYKANMNPGSLTMIDSCMIEPSAVDARPAARYQFERLGYFCADVKDSLPGKPVFNRIVTLKDTWAKIEKTLKNKPVTEQKR